MGTAPTGPSPPPATSTTAATSGVTSPSSSGTKSHDDSNPSIVTGPMAKGSLVGVMQALDSCHYGCIAPLPAAALSPCHTAPSEASVMWVCAKISVPTSFGIVNIRTSTVPDV